MLFKEKLSRNYKIAGATILIAAGGAMVFYFNHPLFFMINGLWSSGLWYPMVFLTAMADGLFIMMISSALYPHKKGYFWPFLAGYILTGVIVQLIKHSYPTGRPLYYFPPEEVFFSGEQLTRKSFPSGHATSALVLTRYLMQNLTPPYKYLVLSLGILMALSRVYLGLHFPFDIYVGGFFGYLTTDLLMRYAEKTKEHSKRFDYRHNPLLVSLLGVTAAVSYIYFMREEYPPLSAFLVFVASGFSIWFLYKTVTQLYNIYRTSGNGKR